jgi:hypothetical protein
MPKVGSKLRENREMGSNVDEIGEAEGALMMPAN